MKYVIVGRAGCGRHELAKALMESGMTVAISQTTREPYYEGEDTHIFLTETEADAIPEEDKIAKTIINGFQFFYAKEQLEKADVIHSDINGLSGIVAALPDTVLHIVYLDIGDNMARKLYSAQRAKDKLKDQNLFEERDMAEDADFSKMEEYVEHMGSLSEYQHQGIIPPEISCVMRYIKDYNPENTKGYASYMCELIKRRRRIAGIIKESIEMDILYVDNDGKPMIAYTVDETTGEFERRPVTVDYFVDSLLASDEGMSQLMRNYITKSKRFDDMDISPES